MTNRILCSILVDIIEDFYFRRNKIMIRYCAECEEEFNEEDVGKCVVCDEPVCDECQADYNQFSQIDYDLHIMCLFIGRE